MPLEGRKIIGPYLNYFFKNYWRSHRYLREIVLILIFHVFFWGFLYGEKPEDPVWTVLGVLAIVLNLVTVPSLFYLEKGNALQFPLVHPNGRRHFFVAKFLLIFLIDFFWVALFSLVYGLRFLDAGYFLWLLPRLAIVALLLLLSTSLLSLSFTYRPWIAWLLILLVVFGGILNKAALFPVQSWKEVYALLVFLLPPFLELIFTAVRIDFNFWQIVFLVVAVLQIVFYFYVNLRLMYRKDLV